MNKLKTLPKEFSDRQYRHGYLDEFINSSLAIQIRTLRCQRDLNQERLAKLTGMKQSQISTLENPDNSVWKVSTLKRLASAFDVALVVRFVPFEQADFAKREFDQLGLRVESFAETREKRGKSKILFHRLSTGCQYPDLSHLLSHRDLHCVPFDTLFRPSESTTYNRVLTTTYTLY